MTILDEFVVTGSRPGPGRGTLDVGASFAAASSRIERKLEEKAERILARDNAFLAPLPLLPEVIVSPPAPTPAPPVPPARIGIPGLTGVLGGLLILLTPSDIGPEPSVDDPGVRPPPRLPPGADDPLTPPNWEDLARPPGDDAFPTRDLPFPSVPPQPEVPELPEIVVSPPQPAPRQPPRETVPSGPLIDLRPIAFPDTEPGPRFNPERTPRSDPAPTTVPIDPLPWGPTEPDPIVFDAPDLVRTPIPDIWLDPVGDTVPEPLVPAPTGKPNPKPPGTTGPTAPPLDPIFLTPLIPEPQNPRIPELFEQPPTTPPPINADSCDCSKPGGGKKKKKKKKDREICYRGTYRQLKKGITYKRIEEVPCDAPKPKKAASRKPSGLGLTQSEGGNGLLDYLKNITEGSDLIDSVLGRTLKKESKAKKRNRKPKTKVGRVPGSIYTSPFPQLGD